jgi:phasin family protein
MMYAEQITTVQKAQLTALHELTGKALAAMEKFAELNLQAVKASLAENSRHAQALLNAKDVKELTQLHSDAVEPLAEKAASYNRHLYEITSGMSAELGLTAESQIADVQKQFIAVVEAAMKDAPQGSEPIVIAVQSALSTATTAMDTMHKAVKKAADAAHANMTAMTDDAVKATRTTRSSRAAASA